MRHLSTWLLIVFFSMCTVTACVHPVGSITREDIENSGGGSGNPGGGSGENPGGSENPGGGENPGSDGDGVFIDTTGYGWQ